MTGTETVIAVFQSLQATGRVTVGGTGGPDFDMVTVPAGSFTMGDNLGWRNERPAHEVYLDAFEIGIKEVTNAQYVRYLNSALESGDIAYSQGLITGRTGPFASLNYGTIDGTPAFPDEFIDYVEVDNYEYQFRVKYGYDDHPIVRLTWYGAAAFCQYYGLRLPTEAEWEKACRGGQQLQYGTLDGEISHDLANFLGTGGQDAYADLAPAGTFPPNPYGLYDMCGNAAEYVFDVYDYNYYNVSPYQNPIGPGPPIIIGRIPGELAVWRGGSFDSYPFYCRSVYRGVIDDQPELVYRVNSIVGFRVARSLQ